MADTKPTGIKSWADEDKPREKLLVKGRKALSNAELIAILIGSGSRNETAVALSRKILADHSNNLVALSKLSVKDLCKYKGIGEAKAISIIAALELGRRQQGSDIQSKPQITCSSDIYQLLRSSMEDLDKEVFKAVYLNRNNKVLLVKTISEGGIAATVVDPRLIFKQALEINAVSIAVAHNHPSGSLFPSQADRAITSKLVEAGKFLEVRLLDHIIISEMGYFSFADEGIW